LLSYIINLPDAVTLGGAYNGGAVYPVGVLGHVSCCSGRWVFSSSSGCVGYLCWRQMSQYNVPIAGPRCVCVCVCLCVWTESSRWRNER